MARPKGSFSKPHDFADFVGELRLSQRSIWSKSVARFLEAVSATSVARQRVLSQSTLLFRAQLDGHRETTVRHGVTRIGHVSDPHPPARMKPLQYSAQDGRANPVGIPHLYLADNPDTAIAEVRPWVGAYVSLARFEPFRDLKIVDCSVDTTPAPFRPSRSSLVERESQVWYDINRAFARPVTSSDTAADYVPTQVLADLFKSQGLDGVMFQGSCSPGRNLVLFSLLLADLVQCNLVVVQEVRTTWSFTGCVYTVP